MKILITGHTGFKGSWLAMMGSELGHEISGLSLNPDRQSNFNLSGVSNFLKNDLRIDIRDYEAVMEGLNMCEPDFIFHLAAQALVRVGHKNPIDTYETNVNGTLNILKASMKLPKLSGILVVTTDKVYKNPVNTRKIFVELDPLGGGDPYSTSKAMADLLTQSWALTNSNLPIGIARAGNVIGGGDFSSDRLIPDIVKNLINNDITSVRYPNAVRPWQHVFDCLLGYFKQMDQLVLGKSSIYNFGPNEDEYISVAKVADLFVSHLGAGVWEQDKMIHPKESQFLALNSSKARLELGWENKYELNQAVKKTAEWYQAYINQDNIEKYSLKQVKDYLS